MAGDVQIVSLRTREHEVAVAVLLGVAQIHRTSADARARGPGIAATYARDDRLQLWGAEEGGALVGIAGVEPLSELLELHDLAVDPARQREGIGRALIAFLRAEYDGSAIVGATLAQAAGFYDRAGFELAEDGTMASGEARLRFTLAT
ncbi:MAG TPA: GNAT family N-acetyltransferase [Dehalococcoidia bacterium]|nr:GNAT family N-acetyltransferase [Dehalococcoidia bacterium]